MPVYTIHQAKTQLSRLIAQAGEGEEVIIARGNTPVALLAPLPKPEPARRTFGAFKGRVSLDERFFEPLPDQALEDWEGGSAPDGKP
ncbi:MAG: hypothetical protein FJX29_07380 [Alphaproteobacteria bacterium]|nr:hypothetical protein [Alphaproteobacteria bacterium]